MSTVKIPFIIIDAFSMLINATPPNPPVPTCEKIIPDWRERFLGSLRHPSRLLRGAYWAMCLIEILVIVASQSSNNIFSKQILSTFIFNHSSPLRVRVTPLFVLGHTIGFLGTALRIYSFRTLGCLFTFELCIRQDHKLIVDGPYSFVRHPSYTGLIMTILGYYCTHVSGSWIKECGLLETILGKLIFFIWSTIACSVIASLLLRMPSEDHILRMKFGDEWEVWAKQVPYKLIPGIY